MPFELIKSQVGRVVFDIQVTMEDGSKTSLLSSTMLVDAAELTAEVNTWKTWALKIQSTTQQAYLNSIIPLTLTKKRVLSLRWGLNSGPDTVWSVAEPYTLLRVETEYQTISTSGTGYAFTMTLVDSLYFLSIEDRVVAHRGTLQAIVERIAAANSMEVLIEPTTTQQLLLVQSYDSDYVFLRRLLDCATSASGFGSYYMFVEGGVLHFHTRAYQAQPLIVPCNTTGGGASYLMATDEAQAHAATGGNVTQMVAYDPLTGNTQILNADPARYTRFGRQLSKAPGSVLYSGHIGPNQQSWEQSRTQSRYAQARDAYERVSFALGCVTSLAPGGIAIVTLPNSSDPAGGPYFIQRVVSTVLGGAMTVVCSAIRGEIASSRPDATAMRDAGSGNAVSQPFEAPGKDPTFTSATTTASLGTGTVVPITRGG